MIQASLCKRIFNLDFPPTETELKLRFRALSKERHPDTGGSHEAFIELKEAYDMLLGYTTVARKYVDRTSEGDLLVDLGRGLGPTTNGAHCKKCGGMGYKIETRVTSYSRIECPFCQTRCGRCAGKGRLINGQCPECIGSGIFINPNCTSCNRSTLYSKLIQAQVYITCSPCGGRGEIEIMNPVLPKGGMR